MAGIALPTQHRPSRSIGNMLPPPTVRAAPKIEMIPNPDFAFPSLPQTPRDLGSAPHPSVRRRPMSVNMGSVCQRPQTADAGHKKAISTLPNFSFNAANATGLSNQQDLDAEPSQSTPSRSGHTRNTSEFVGGVGVSGAISASPTRPSGGLQLPETRGHRHRRSMGVSSHDLAKMMQAPEPPPRLSSSLPSTPLEHPAHTSEPPGTFGPALPNPLCPQPSDDARPPSRPRVGFSDNVEYISRPLSTISSETESSLSTVRGHSFNNSISSVLSLSTPSPPSSRARAISLGTTLEDEPRTRPKSSLLASKRIEKEGQWLKHGSSNAKVNRPAAQPDTESSQLTFDLGNAPTKSRTPQKKRHSANHSLGFDRRRSEPAMGVHTLQPSRLSALSLQEPSSHQVSQIEGDEYRADHRRSSTRRIKDWAVSKITRRPRPQSECLMPKSTAPSELTPPTAETDLDAVFNMDVDDVQSSGVHMQAISNTYTPSVSHKSSFDDDDSGELGMMLDLDAALGSFKTPSLGSQKPRKQLHSFNHPKETFSGPGLHYQPFQHGRTLSAPVLSPFDHMRTGTPPQQPMADVFEEEEEDDALATKPPKSSSMISVSDETAGVGVSIVDHEESAGDATPSEASLDDGLGFPRSAREPDRPGSSYDNLGFRLSTHGLERPASSIIDQTIIEEASPVDTVAIIPDYEEPRAHSLTKSDSSEAPTILAAPGLLSLPDGEQSLTNPETYHSSAFSSPDLARRQGSFDTSRVGTSASSITTDNRTVSSCTTGEPVQDLRVSVDDVPSLTSSRSTMTSAMHVNSSRRDVSGIRIHSLSSGQLDPVVAAEQRRKRTSIHSLSQLVSGSFGPRAAGYDSPRPQTAAAAANLAEAPRKKDNRLKKLMFWKSKNRQTSTSTISQADSLTAERMLDG